MKPELTQKQIVSMSPEELFLSAVTPIAREMHRGGGGPDHKYDVYQQLTDRQRAAFMYWVLHSHAADEAQFYTWIPYMRAPTSNYWAQLTRGMELIGYQELLTYMEKCGQVFEPLDQDKPDWTAFDPRDLQNTALHAQIQALYEEFKELAPMAVEFIGQYMREHASSFLNTIPEA